MGANQSYHRRHSTALLTFDNRERFSRTHCIPLIAPPVILLLVPLVALLLQTDFFSWDNWLQGPPAVPTSKSEVIRNLGLLAAGVIGLCFGIWRAYTAHRQANIAEQGQFTERFTKAAQQLGNEQLSVHLGGIYSLWRLARDSDEGDLVSVMDILCAFVRDPTPDRAPAPAPEQGEGHVGDAVASPSVRPDVQAILTLIGRADDSNQRRLSPDYRFNLVGADLRGAGISNLTGAVLERANLRDASPNNSNLTGAYLFRANLTGAQLWFASLAHADLVYANLSGANLRYANLARTDLGFANLTGADLRGAKNLTQGQLDEACVSQGGSPPELSGGLTPPTNICED